MSQVILEGVNKRFGKTTAVNELSLHINAGEIFTLLGPSGCGKTTTLRLIAGFEQPDDGAVKIGQTLMAQGNRAVPPERRGVGMVFQEHALFPNLTVEQNVAFGLVGPRSSRARRAAEVLQLVGLEECHRRYPHELSGGQQQRVGLARALAPSPQVILLDEPFSNVDAAFRSELRNHVQQVLKKVGATAILVTHDQQDAFAISDRIAVINQGRVEQVGPPRELYRQPASAFVATFVGQANLVQGKVAGNDRACVMTCLGDVPCPGGCPADGDVTLCIRRECLNLDPAGPFQGSVVTTVFQGDNMELLVEVGQGEHKQILVMHADPQVTYRTGDMVRFTVDSEAVAIVT